MYKSKKMFKDTSYMQYSFSVSTYQFTKVNPP